MMKRGQLIDRIWMLLPGEIDTYSQLIDILLDYLTVAELKEIVRRLE